MKQWILIGLGVLLMLATPALAQAPTPTPTPQSLTAIGLALLGGLAVLAVEAARRYINGRIDVGIERERKRIEQFAKTEETESSIRLATITAEQQEQHADAESLRLLAESINKMTTEISNAYTSLATDRQQARDERKGFQLTLNNQSEELKRQGEELITLKTLVNTLVTDTETVRELARKINDRIGGNIDDPSLTRMLTEATEAVKDAARTVTEAAASARALIDSPAPIMLQSPQESTGKPAGTDEDETK